MSDEADPKPTQPEMQFSDAADEAASGFDSERNRLLNKLLAERLERDKQRRRHRTVVICAASILGIAFYTLFGILVFGYFERVDFIEKIPTALIAPLLALVSVPTIIFIILIFCIYRQKPTDIPQSLLSSIRQDTQSE